MTTSDVLIATMIPEDAREGDRSTLSEVRQGVDITSEIRVEQLSDETQILDACSLRGFEFQPQRMFGAYYSLVRTNPPQPRSCNWDPDQKLHRAVVFSRLVHRTPIGYRYCARVRSSDEGTLRQVVPFYLGLPAFGGDLARPWLTGAEWKDVGVLLGQWETSVAKECPRINRALWYFEKAAMESYLNVRWPLLATCIEALVGEWQEKAAGGRLGRGKRFVDGLQRLGHECKCSLSKNEAQKAWERRSRLVHGARLPPEELQPTNPRDPLYEKVEGLLAKSIRSMVQLDSLASEFLDSKAITTWLASD